MKTILNWLYENWMKGTPFLALYTFILIWLYGRTWIFPWQGHTGPHDSINRGVSPYPYILQTL